VAWVPAKIGRSQNLEEAFMTLAELAYEQMKTLPDEQAREVLDFIGFLKEKRERAEILDLMAALETALSHIWDNPEDDEAWDKL
jgi:hypothetical protein